MQELKQAGFADEEHGSRGSRPSPMLTQGPALLRNPGAVRRWDPAGALTSPKSRYSSPAPATQTSVNKKNVSLHRRGKKDRGTGI